MNLSTLLTRRAYNVIIGLVLFEGFFVNYIMCKCFASVFSQWNYLAVIIGYFVCAIAGICMSRFSDSPIISFIGYNLVVLPIGVVLSIALKDEYTDLILRTCLLTAVLTLCMIFLAVIFPDFFLSMGKLLFICLLGAVVGDFLLLLTIHTLPTWWDLIIACVFMGYIGYDWSKAQTKELTFDNAIDSAVDLYLDIINLFIRLLGNSKSSKGRR